MKTITLSTYETLASEYYNSTRHPTCANFRYASQYILNNWLALIDNKSGYICEVGPGRSLVAELLYKRNRELTTLILIDSSPLMLSYSDHWNKQGTTLILGNAESLTLKSASMTAVISSLGDPYNSRQFWKETNRVLKTGGLVFLTTPSYEWAVSYRKEYGTSTQIAEFDLANGSHIGVPSFIYPPEEQIRLIESCGFTVEEVVHTHISDLKMNQISPKLLVTNKPNLSIVTGFLAKNI